MTSHTLPLYTNIYNARDVLSYGAYKMQTGFAISAIMVLGTISSVVLFADESAGLARQSDWEHLLMGYGPLGLIAAILGFFVLKYGSRSMEAHLSLVATLKDSAQKQTVSMEALTRSVVKHDDFKRHTGKSIRQTARALVQLIETQRNIQLEVAQHRKLQEKLNEKIDSKVVFAIQAGSVEIPLNEAEMGLDPGNPEDARLIDKIKRYNKRKEEALNARTIRSDQEKPHG